jgi:hypothetical protein
LVTVGSMVRHGRVRGTEWPAAEAQSEALYGFELAVKARAAGRVVRPSGPRTGKVYASAASRTA